MPAKLDWRTDEKEREPWHSSFDDTAPQRVSPGLHWAAAALLLAGLVVFLAWREAKERVADVEATTGENVRSAHTLATKAAERKDEELFTSLLSGRVPGWTTTQRRRLQAGLLYADTARPLGFRPLMTTESAVETSLDPALQEATLTVEQQYVVTGTDGMSDTVSLQQTFVYRQGKQRWLFSPPPDGFWGRQMETHRERLTLSYPRRDEGIARRLARDLEAVLQRVCRLPWPRPACSGDFRLRVHLSPEPDVMLSLADAQHNVTTGGVITLPAPSLVGRPADDAAYRALFRGYASHVVTAFAAEATGYRCCRQFSAYQTLVHRLLSHLNLRPWPLTSPANTMKLLDEFATLQELEALWTASDPVRPAPNQRLLLHAAVDFVHEQNGASPAEMLAAIARGVGLSKLLGGPVAANELDWRHYVYNRVQGTQAQVEPTIPLPQQDLVFSCYEDGHSRVYYYHTQTETITEGVTGMQGATGYSLLLGLPGDNRVILAPSRTTTDNAPLLSWQPGGIVTALRHPKSDSSFVLARRSFVRRTLDPRGRYLPTWLFVGGASRAENILLNVEACEEACSQWIELSNNGTLPRWSPDGDEVLWARDSRVYRGSPAAPHPIGAGVLPFWLDGQSYGYLSEGNVYVAQTPYNEARLLLTINDLLAAIPEAGPGFRSSINSIEADPSGSGSLAFFVQGHSTDDNYLLLLRGSGDGAAWTESDVRPGELSVLLQTRATIYTPPDSGFSPDGGWLAVRTRSNGPQGAQLFLYDLRALASGPRFRLSAYGYHEAHDWSRDGRWLARPMSNFVMLLAPEGPDRRFLFAPNDYERWSECTSVVWVNQ